MQSFKKLIADTNQNTVLLLKSHPALLLATFITSVIMLSICDQLLATGQGAEINHISVALLQLSIVLTLYGILLIVATYSVIKHQQKIPATLSLYQYLLRNAKPLVAENIRAFSITLLWLMLLIIPGIFKYIRLSFVSYVVLADPNYQKGEVDALERSNELVKGFTLPLFILIVIYSLIDPLSQYARGLYPIFTHPLQALIISFVLFIAYIYSNILLFLIYQLRVEAYERVKNGTHV